MGLCGCSQDNVRFGCKEKFIKSVLAYLVGEDEFREFMAFTEIETFAPGKAIIFNANKLVLILEGQIIASVSKSTKVSNLRSRKNAKKLSKIMIAADKGSKMAAKVYNAGDVILLPVTEMSSMSPLLLESLYVTSKLKLTFHAAQSPDLSVTATKLLTVSLDALTRFIMTRKNACPMFDVLGVRMSDVFGKEELFRGLTATQLNILCPLLSIHTVKQGDLLVAEQSVLHKLGQRGRHSSQKKVKVLLNGQSPCAQDENGLSVDSTVSDAWLDDDATAMCFVLTGKCARVTPAKFLQELQERDCAVNPQSSSLDSTTRTTGLKKSFLGSLLSASSKEKSQAASSPKGKDMSAHRNSIVEVLTGLRKHFKIEPYCTTEDNRIDFEDSPDLQDSLEFDSSYPSLYCGQELCLLPVDHIAISTVVAREDCVVGTLSRKALQAIGLVDPLFVQTLKDNFAFQLLRSVQSSVPLFKDMSDVHLRALAQRVLVTAYAAEETLALPEHCGGFDDRFCVLAYGAVKYEHTTHQRHHSAVPSSPLNNVSPHFANRNNHDEPSSHHSSGGSGGFGKGVLRAGQFFGEIALLSTDSDLHSGRYFSAEHPSTQQSTQPSSQYSEKQQVSFEHIKLTALRPTVLLSIDEKSFQSIFSAAPLHLTELKLRLTGRCVELVHVLLHPRGYLSFFQFLESELAAESLLFWNEVRLLEEQCKHFAQLLLDMKRNSLNLPFLSCEYNSESDAESGDDAAPYTRRKYGALAVHSIYTSGASSSAGSMSPPSLRNLSDPNSFNNRSIAVTPRARRESVKDQLEKLVEDRRRHSEVALDYKKIRDLRSGQQTPQLSPQRTTPHSPLPVRQCSDNVHAFEDICVSTDSTGVNAVMSISVDRPSLIVTGGAMRQPFFGTADSSVKYHPCSTPLAPRFHSTGKVYPASPLTICTTGNSYSMNQQTQHSSPTCISPVAPPMAHSAHSVQHTVHSTRTSGSVTMSMYQMSSHQYREMMARQTADSRHSQEVRVGEILRELLRAVAFICEQYIVVDSDYQINIASHLRNELLTLVNDFNSRCSALIRQQDLHLDQTATNSNARPPPQQQQQQRNTFVSLSCTSAQQCREVSLEEVERLLSRALGLYSRAKFDVYNVLKSGNFLRYKKTEEFAEFMRLVKPFHDMKHQH